VIVTRQLDITHGEAEAILLGLQLVAEQKPIPPDVAGDLAQLVAKVSTMWTADEWAEFRARTGGADGP
jgi:hypothetical protein